MWVVAMLSVFFFFQAEDGIRDVAVTGVQTCALPICIRVAVEKLDAPPEQRPRRPVRNRAELRLGSGNVEPAQRHHDDVGRERRELLPGTGSRPLAWGAADEIGRAHV